MTRTDFGAFLDSERGRRFAWTVIITAVVLRVLWSAWIAHAEPSAVVSGDSDEYLGPAHALVESGRFSLSPTDDTPMFLRTPGYPAFLGAILWVTDSEWAISPIQAALSILSVLVVVWIGRRMISPSAGLLAGMIVAVDPMQFAMSGSILTESLWTLVIAGIAAAAIPVFARPPKEVPLGSAFLLGAIIACSNMIRPTHYYFPALVAVLLAVRLRSRGLRSVVAVIVAFSLPIVLVVGGWQLRNHRTVDSWELSGSASLTLMCWHGAEIESRVQNVDITVARSRIGCHPGGWNNLEPRCPPWWACDVEDPVAHGPSWDEMRRRGIEIILDHPAVAAEVYARGLALEIGAPGTSTVARFLDVGELWPLTALLLVWSALVWLFAALGTVVGLRSEQRWYWGFVVASIAYVMLVSAGANSAARFRGPLIPLLALLVALGARSLADRQRSRRRAPQALTAR